MTTTPPPSETPECDGACEEHIGDVRRVHVQINTGHDWGEFNYCEAAIDEDRARGLIVALAAERELKK